MPLCTLHLITFRPTIPETTISTFLNALSGGGNGNGNENKTKNRITPILSGQPIRWIIVPEKFSPGPIPLRDPNLLNSPKTSTTTETEIPPPPPPTHSILLLLPGSNGIPATNPASNLILSDWNLLVGVPGGILTEYLEQKKKSKTGVKEGVGGFTGSLDNPVFAREEKDGAQKLELTRELLGWCLGKGEKNEGEEGKNGEGRGRRRPKGPITMLNLLAFKSHLPSPSPPSPSPSQPLTPHTSYQLYGQSFASHEGISRGGVAKIVGRVITPSKNTNKNEKSTSKKEEEEGGGWDEIALAHYPSTAHFADMLAGEDYQRINKRWRVPSLEDTCILCVDEVGIEGEGEKAKL